jgi:DnaJ-class molecular chaperone
MSYFDIKRVEVENRVYFARLRGEEAEFAMCPTCKGEGDEEVPCPRCAGKGEVVGECEHCGSWTDIECKACEGCGVKLVTCSGCEGDGYVRPDSEPSRRRPSTALPLFRERQMACADE